LRITKLRAKEVSEWTPEQDEKILENVKKYGIKKWSQIANDLDGKELIDIQQRWFNKLNPKIKKGRWRSLRDDVKLIICFEFFGAKYAKIASFFPEK
jgi:myb proto-oncogene protein